jgi:hypothetical protein
MIGRTIQLPLLPQDSRKRHGIQHFAARAARPLRTPPGQ